MLISLIVFSAKYLFVVIPLIAVIYTLMQSKSLRKKILTFSVVNLPVIFIISQIVSRLYYNPRPFVQYHFKPLVDHAANNGFPSDHALLSFAIASIIFVFNKKLGIILGVLGFMVGSSRVLSGIHSPVDVLGSFVISATTTYIIYRVLISKFVTARKKIL